MFVGVHAMLAMQTKTPELAITDLEGKSFMTAAQNVLRHYSVETTQKTLDWVAFAGIAGGMYGSRIVAIANRKAEERGGDKARGKVLRFPDRVRAPTSAPQADISPQAEAPHDYMPSVVPGEPDGSEGF